MVACGAMRGFIFQFPELLSLLPLVMLLGWLLARARKLRRAVVDALGGGHPTNRTQRDALRLAAVVLGVLTLARPGYSPRLEPTTRTGRDVVFALDVSQSMLAEDVSPSRLDVAKQGVRDALKAMGNERAGLVVYAGSASVLCPLTYDYDFVRYMLDQAQPRTVDFGGTTLQAAVEKAVDQVFVDGREGMQDLVVLTDGGDNGSKLEQMVKLLDEKQVDVLLVGIGDSETGSPIPILDDEGNPKLLESEGSTVMTKLEDEALRDFTDKSTRVHYVAAGAQAFDLGVIYQTFSKDLRHDSAVTEAGLRVYQEAAVFFLIPALILLVLAECWGARGLRLSGGVVVFFMCVLAAMESKAAGLQTEFGEAVGMMAKGDYQEASMRFSEICENASASEAGPADLGALQFNRGLCLLKLAESQAGNSATEALATALDAQRAFLAARRSAPDLKRAGQRLESTATVLASLRKQVAEQEAAQREVQKELQKLLDRLQALLKSQQALRSEILSKESARDEAPLSPEAGEKLSRKEDTLKVESKSVQSEMKILDENMHKTIPGVPPIESILTEPIKLMTDVRDAQDDMATELKVRDAWPTALAHGRQAEKTLEQIIEILSNNNADPGESDEEGDEIPEDGDFAPTDDSQPSTADSKAAEGDLAAGAEMQALPVPNYSAEDVLKEEQGSLQFRQQKRGGANASKVKKDY